MDTIQGSPPGDWREFRRLRALELHRQGWRQVRIAEALGVSRGAVCQWLKRVSEGGPDSLRHRKSPGAPRRLSQEQRARLPLLLAQGPEAFGWSCSVWTTARVAALVQREFGVKYHPDHIGRVLQSCGWSPQKPMRRAAQRNEEAIRTWREERWPELKKKP